MTPEEVRNLKPRQRVRFKPSGRDAALGINVLGSVVSVAHNKVVIQWDGGEVSGTHPNEMVDVHRVKGGG